MRLKVSFCVYDRFGGNMDNLINLASTLKSPDDLLDTFLQAVSKTKMPLSYASYQKRYHLALKEIEGPAD